MHAANIVAMRCVAAMLDAACRRTAARDDARVHARRRGAPDMRARRAAQLRDISS